jgi:hypothetical protein
MNTPGKAFSSPDPSLNSVAATLTTNPPNADLQVGEIFTVEIVTAGVADLYGLELNLTFDPAVVNVVGTAITPGVCPQPDFVVSNTVDNLTGEVVYATTQLNPTPPCSGGVAAEIAFQAVAVGLSPLHFSHFLLADSDGSVIPTEAVDGSLSVSSGYKVYIPVVLR